MISAVLAYSGSDHIIEFCDAWMRPLPQFVQSFISTLIVQVIPIFLIYGMNVFLVRGDAERKTFTNLMLAFAMGGLLGDVFFHTLPHLAEEDHDHSHAHIHAASENGHHAHSEEAMQINLVIIMGIWCFFMIEKFTQMYIGGDSHGHSHGHSHSHEAAKPVQDKKANPKKKGGKTSPETNESSKEVAKSSEADEAQERRYKSFAVISIVGDFIHNFTDGLSIGVSFVADFKMGLVTTMAMFFHEIPHEVGDFAILFQLKYSLW